jgi:hypothetical protein
MDPEIEDFPQIRIGRHAGKRGSRDFNIFIELLSSVNEAKVSERFQLTYAPSHGGDNTPVHRHMSGETTPERDIVRGNT